MIRPSFLPGLLAIFGAQSRTWSKDGATLEPSECPPGFISFMSSADYHLL